MKMFADKDKSDRSFAVGDWVLLKLQPHRQVTLRMHKQHKFSLKFNGPFQVEAKCGEVAYKLTLPDAATIHNWSNGNVDDATWEVATDLQARSTDVIGDGTTCSKHKTISGISGCMFIERVKFLETTFNDWFLKLKGIFIDNLKTIHLMRMLQELKIYCLRKQALMKGYMDQLERLGYVLPQDLSVGLILNGLTSEFAGFVRNYNMHNIGKTIGELHAMLIEYEKGKGKANGNEKDKQVYIPKPKNPKPTAKEHPAKDDTCHHCKEVGHWKRNCPVYLAELLKKKKQVGTASSSGIFTIELFSFPNKSWVYDTGCGTHICITKQGLRGARKLEQGALYLYVGNGVRAQVEAIGSFDLVLPNGLVICLDNCHYAPTITRGVVSVHRLVENGFVQCFTDYGILVSKNDVLYFNAIPRDGIYEIDMHNLVPNVNSIYNVSNKRAKHNLDSTYLWHCRLAHISKKRIEKLQHEGLLKSTDDESFGFNCVSVFTQAVDRTLSASY
ncbi:retrotransposon protein, putative, ty1-copia subclass [Tanacetum coccineum]